MQLRKVVTGYRNNLSKVGHDAIPFGEYLPRHSRSVSGSTHPLVALNFEFSGMFEGLIIASSEAAFLGRECVCFRRQRRRTRRRSRRRGLVSLVGHFIRLLVIDSGAAGHRRSVEIRIIYPPWITSAKTLEHSRDLLAQLHSRVPSTNPAGHTPTTPEKTEQDIAPSDR